MSKCRPRYFLGRQPTKNFAAFHKSLKFMVIGWCSDRTYGLGFKPDQRDHFSGRGQELSQKIGDSCFRTVDRFFLFGTDFRGTFFPTQLNYCSTSHPWRLTLDGQLNIGPCVGSRPITALHKPDASLLLDFLMRLSIIQQDSTFIPTHFHTLFDRVEHFCRTFLTKNFGFQ